MVIKQIEFYEIKVPALPDAVASKTIDKPLHKLPVGAAEGWSIQFDQLPKLLIKLSLKNGIVGWGEFYRDHQWTIIEQMAKMILGRDIRSFSLQHLPFAFCREYDGFECAIYDAFAKAHGLRIVDLLGGPVQERIRVGAWSSHREKEEIPDLARKFSNLGFDCIKFKADLEDDVQTWCESIQVVDDKMQVIFDPNERWETSGETRKRMHQLSDLSQILDQYGELARQHQRIPVQADWYVADLYPRPDGIKKVHKLSFLTLPEVFIANYRDKAEWKDVLKILKRDDPKVAATDKKNKTFYEIVDKINAWTPDRKRGWEEGYKIELRRYLEQFYDVEEEVGETNIDLLLNKKYPIEIKKDPTTSEYDRLLGQMIRHNKQYGSAIAVVTSLSSQDRFIKFQKLFVDIHDKLGMTAEIINK